MTTEELKKIAATYAAADHAGTVDDPIPQQLLYTKTAEDGTKKVYTVAAGVTISGGGSANVKHATDTVVGIVKLTDDATVDAPAATGYTALTPNGAKVAIETAKTEINQGITDTVNGAIDDALADGGKLDNAIDDAIQDKIDSGEIGQGGGDTTPLIVKPTIISPIEGATNVSVITKLQASAYKSLLDTETRKHRVFEVYTVAEPSSKVFSTEVNADEAAISPQLSEQTQFKWRCRDVSINDLKSAWSGYASFTTGNAIRVEQPTLEIVGGNTDVMETPTFNAGTFTITPAEHNSPEQHVSTTWTLSKVVDGEGFPQKVWSSDNDAVNKTSITLAKGILEASGQYTMSVVYNSRDFGSSSAGVVSFTCAVQFTHIAAPTLTCSEGTTNVGETPTINGSVFTVLPSGSDTHAWTTWRVNLKDSSEVYKLEQDSSNLTILNIPSGVLKPSQTYTVSCVYCGTTYGESKAGTLEFSTAAEFVGPKVPTISVQGTEADAVTFLSEFVTSEPTYIGSDSEKCTKSEWILFKGDEQVWQKANATGVLIDNLSEFNGYALTPSTQYELRCRHYFSPSKTWSGYGSVTFTTAAEYGRPTIKFKATGTLNLNKLTAWWDYNKLKVYIDGAYNETLTNAPATDLVLTGEQTVEIVNETEPTNYPYLYLGEEETKLKVTEMLAPLPLLRATNNGAAITDFGGDVGKERFAPCFDTANLTKYGLFTNAHSLTKLCAGLFRFNPQVVNFGSYGGGGAGGGVGSEGGRSADGTEEGDGYAGCGCFQGCTGLTELPSDLFKYTTAVTNFGGHGGGGGGGGSSSVPNYHDSTPNGGAGGVAYGCFQGCTGLTELPSDLFKYTTAVTNFGGYAGGDGGSGHSLNNATRGKGGNGGDGHGAFELCTSLRRLPSDLFKYTTKVVNFSGCGSDSSTSKGTGCFQGCTGLTELPSDLFKYTTAVTNFGGYAGGDGGSYGAYGGAGGGGAGGYGGGGGGHRGSSSGVQNGAAGSGITGGEGGGGNGGAGGGHLTDVDDLYWYDENSPEGCHGCFEGCSNLASVPVNLFQTNTKIKQVIRMFAQCRALTAVVRFKATSIERAEEFAYASNNRGTVYVPTGSTTATTFKSAGSAYVNAIEE